jgi:hypothetical protein
MSSLEVRLGDKEDAGREIFQMTDLDAFLMLKLMLITTSS